VCVVGPGTRFLSGITYYTYALSNALADAGPVCTLFMRRLLPARLYPGYSRVGNDITQVTLDPSINSFDGIDWFWMPSLFRAIRFLRRESPQTIVLQWWTGTVLHSYLVIALIGKLLKARLVIEFHEVLDTGEDRMSLVGKYVRMVGPRLFRFA